ncbi:MAG: glutathione S-transferase N-terminal domain-containing protein [Rhodospirillales bacterium]|nr:glutathione S-transferase N-terminal domain-containing protein [Rhodospirillales bacterium]
MKLYYAPGACSIGIHILLEEIGRPYEAVAVDLRGGEHRQPAFMALNPKSKVPALVRDDGSLLTEFPAIAFWLARTHPAAKLLPDDLEAQTRALEVMEYVTATVHMQGFSRILHPERFAPTEADFGRVEARGGEIVASGFRSLDRALGGRDYLLGDFSIADAALFYVEFWAVRRRGMTLSPNLSAHFARMLARPAVARVLRREGVDH